MPTMLEWLGGLNALRVLAQVSAAEQIVGRERNHGDCHRQLVRNVVTSRRVNSTVGCFALVTGMDADSKQAARILAALAESRGRSMELVRRFQSMPEVSKVSFDFVSSRNQSYWEFNIGSPYIFEWYVDVALLPGDSGPNVLKKFPDRTALTIDEFVHQLKEATSELLETADLINSQI